VIGIVGRSRYAADKFVKPNELDTFLALMDHTGLTGECQAGSKGSRCLVLSKSDLHKLPTQAAGCVVLSKSTVRQLTSKQVGELFSCHDIHVVPDEELLDRPFDAATCEEIDLDVSMIREFHGQ
jgi:hypothetical protein